MSTWKSAVGDAMRKEYEEQLQAGRRHAEVTTDRPSPLELLTDGVASLTGQLQEDGTLHDPVFDTPTQYGGAYYAWCCAVLAAELGGSAADAHRELAEQSLAAALAHTADPDREPYASGFDRRTLSVTGRLNHRDFTWPPILKTYLALSRLGVAWIRRCRRRWPAYGSRRRSGPARRPTGRRCG